MLKRSTVGALLGTIVKMKNYIVIFSQIIVWFVFCFLRLFYRVKINHNLNLDKKKKYVIVANHPSKIDPFMICSYMPVKEIFKLIPFRYLTTEYYMKKRHLNLILKLCGCFSTTPKGAKPLDLAKKFLERGETVVIFPEGKRNIKNVRDRSIKLGVGAIYLEKNISDCSLLPVRISYAGRDVEINYGFSITHGDLSGDYYPMIDKVMDYVYGIKSSVLPFFYKSNIDSQIYSPSNSPHDTQFRSSK